MGANKMKKNKYLAILILMFLAACNVEEPITRDPQQATHTPGATLTIHSTISMPISTAVPSVVSTAMVTPIPQTPSPWPTVPLIITPSADQLARWQEYEKSLAETFLSHIIPENVICEWVLLGQSEEEIYVWVSCQSVVPNINGRYAGISAPGVIYLGTDGSIQNIRRIVTWSDEIQNYFPPDLQDLLFSGEIKPQVRQMFGHIDFRMENPEPPLIVLSATSMP